MEKPNKHPADEVPEAKAVYAASLRSYIDANHIPEEALHDWLDVFFRNEAVPDNNIVWSRGVQSFAQYLTTEELASGFEHAQWRATIWNGLRVMVEISSSLSDSESSKDVAERHEKLQGYYAHKELFEEKEIRARLLDSFSQSATELNYRYMVNAKDVGWNIDDYELEDALVFSDNDVYVPMLGLTWGLRAYEPEVPLSAYVGTIGLEDYITDCQTNTLYNEDLWNLVEQAAPNPQPSQYLHDC